MLDCTKKYIESKVKSGQKRFLQRNKSNEDTLLFSGVNDLKEE